MRDVGVGVSGIFYRKYHKGSGRANSIYDDDTESAVEKFQEQKGLSQDGVVGPQTRRLLGIS
ncbi:peptidoglycan-binding domain-containing protein [Anabaena sp. AL09]|uniref:peptidoglycan-binding protein n=1 Tax=Anabaena sp. AL09 TaxID=1710891 RepID=UPI0007FC2546|nr:peptidoglycan-binding domain-containing protein [Anabaena sp. AL09]OBQ10923.1 MAG: hypothetical protein AN490_06455 [Anabaena sp. AL09]